MAIDDDSLTWGNRRGNGENWKERIKQDHPSHCHLLYVYLGMPINCN